MLKKITLAVEGTIITSELEGDNVNDQLGDRNSDFLTGFKELLTESFDIADEDAIKIKARVLKSSDINLEEAGNVSDNSDNSDTSINNIPDNSNPS